MSTSARLRAVAPFVLLALAACDESAGLSDDGFPVTEAGPLPVGYRQIELTYDPGDERTSRTLRVSVWYPATDDAVNLPTAQLASTFLGRETNALLDAPARPPAYRAGYPVVAHSHGDWGYSNQNFHVGEGLARHGYVVVAPMHEGNTALEAGNRVDLLSTVYDRPADIRAVLDMLETGLPAGDPLRGQCNTEQVVVSGHSRGTSTVMSLLGLRFDRAAYETRCTNGDYAAAGGCSMSQLAQFDVDYHDDRIVAALLVGGDGGGTFVGGQAAYDAVTTPMLFMTGTDDGAYSGVLSRVAAFDGPEVALAMFTGGCHNLFAGGGCTNVTDGAAWPVIDTYYVAHARRYLFDDQGQVVTSILDGTTSLSGIVTFTP